MISTKVKLLFFLLLILSSSIVLSQNGYNDCDIYFVDGSQKKGRCDIPQSHGDKGFYYKKGKQKREYIESSLVKRISVTTRKGNNFSFDFLPVGKFNFEEKKVKLKDSYQWFLLNYSTKYMDSYIRAHEYTIGKDGKLTALSGSFTSTYSIALFLKKNKDDYAHFITEYSDGFVDNSLIKKNLFYYLKDYPQVFQIINKRNIDWGKLNEVPEIYSWYIKKVNNKL